MTKSTRASASEPDRIPDDLTFEKALAELEKLVARLEGGELGLEQALEAHRRGLALARFCQRRLEAAQQQVKVLEGDALKPLSAPDAQTGGAQTGGAQPGESD